MDLDRQAAIELHGTNLIAGEDSTDGATTFKAPRPRTGERGEVAFHEATDGEVSRACAAAADAAGTSGFADRRTRARLLRTVADQLDDARPRIVPRADRETGLGTGRLEGELGRTTDQLRMFADHIDEGSYLDVIIDRADPASGRPDLRRMKIPLGPVAVFGASNFPLAFSVAGGDTASALAAGCPVVVKAHPSHPGTSELVGRTIAGCVSDLGLDGGVFSLIQGGSNAVGEATVTHPDIAAVAFTGSLAGGRAIFDLAAERDAPIPVYAEMGSLNPVFVTGRALGRRGAQIAAGYVGSATLGTGQFCTKPGLAFVEDGADADAFEQTVASALADTGLGYLLNAGIRDRFVEQTSVSAGRDGVSVVATRTPEDERGLGVDALIVSVSVEDLFAEPGLLEEHFGPFSIVVRCDGPEQMAAAARRLPGNLAAAVHAEREDDVSELVAVLTGRVGRIVFDGFPTGVAVTHAMHHGGPYPATTSVLHTSVGTTAIRRFLRPVVYQDAPPERLPPELADGNPTGVGRQVDGRVTDRRPDR